MNMPAPADLWCLGLLLWLVWSILSFLSFIGVWLIYIVVLVSDVKQSESAVHKI